MVGLYVDPPAHAVVLSVGEKSRIQALDRTQPGLPMKPGRTGTMTHDYKRNGTTTLFAALNVLDGTIIGRNMKRHRHQEFIRFLNDIDTHVPKPKAIHARSSTTMRPTSIPRSVDGSRFTPGAGGFLSSLASTISTSAHSDHSIGQGAGSGAVGYVETILEPGPSCWDWLIQESACLKA